METWVAERLCRVIPCAEMVRFVKTGSEATEAAIRVARRVTSRDLIVTVKDGYHSWHSWFQVVKDFHPGIPDFYKEGVLYANYNDLKGFAYLFDRIADNIAAVILEPCHNEPPAPGFLEGLRKLCDDYGAILIFDEMVTGFRWANGGAQEYFQVTPDLACFGKACANGFPLAFLCGRADLMAEADVISGTFGGEVLSLAVCEAVLDIYAAEPVVTAMWARGWQLVGGLRDTIGAIDAMVPVVCDGYPIKPRIRFTSPIEDNNLNAMSLFLELTAASGLLIHPAGFNLSYAMTREDIEDAIRKISIALFAVAEAYELGHFPLKGNQIQPSLGVRTA
jgi:glutamate-1-semialdehyde 2,1-aminomutase